jgi:hypothetical protein
VHAASNAGSHGIICSIDDDNDFDSIFGCGGFGGGGRHQ